MANANWPVPSAHAAPEYSSTSHVLLHPLVIVNITDHYTRLRVAASGSSSVRAVGAIIGQQNQRSVEIHTSFEALFSVARSDDGEPTVKIDIDFMKNKMAQYTQVFPAYDILGWYMTGSGLSRADIEVTHRAVCTAFLENPLVLVMDTNPGANVRTLPVYLFETVGKAASSTLGVRRIPYTVESEESERVGIDTAMKVDFAQAKNPTLVPQAERLGSAIGMLHLRINVLLAYLADVKKGAVEPDFELLRKIKSLCNQLPCADSPGFTAAMRKEYEDAVLMTYLAVVTKATTQLSKLVDKSQVFNVQKRGGLGGPFGFMA